MTLLRGEASKLRRTTLVILSLLLFPSPGDSRNYYALSNIRVIDGDTVEADVNLDYGITLRKQTIRADDYDAWESTYHRKTITITEEEIRKGKAAEKDLRKFLSDKTLLLSPGREEKDSYGRLLGTLYYDTTQEIGKLKDYMKKKGHIRDSSP